MKYATTVGSQTFTIDVNRDDQVTVDGETFAVDLISIEQGTTFSLLLNNDSHEVLVNEENGVYQVLLLGHLFNVSVEDERARRLAQAAHAFVPTSGEVQIRAPMPGLVIAIPATEGQIVKEGEVLVILESMKMENELKAPRDGTVSAVRVQPGHNTEQGQILVTIT
jgi:biotin carboxyl carrier protein